MVDRLYPRDLRDKKRQNPGGDSKENQAKWAASHMWEGEVPYKTREQAIGESLETSATQLSSLARQVAYGLVAFALAMLVSDSSFPKMVATEYRSQLIVIAAFGSFAVLADYFQYLFGYLGSATLLRREGDGNSKLVYVGVGFFIIKQVCSVIGAVYLAYLIGGLLMHHT